MKTKPTPASQKTRRGGRRPGAGRKPADPTGPRVNFTGARVHLYTNGILAEEARCRGIGTGQLLDQFAEGLGELHHVIYDVQRRAAAAHVYAARKADKETEHLLGLPKNTLATSQRHPRLEISALDSVILGLISVAEALDGVTVANVFGKYDSARHAVESFVVEEDPTHNPKLSAKEMATLDRYIALAKTMVGSTPGTQLGNQ